MKSHLETEVLNMRSKDQRTIDSILKFVNKYYQESHSSPTINEVAAGVGVSRATAHRYLLALGEKGLLAYDRGISAAPESAKMKTAAEAETALLLSAELRCLLLVLFISYLPFHCISHF